MNLKRLIYSDVGRIVISIILGLGLATLFRRVCKERKLFSISCSSIK